MGLAHWILNDGSVYKNGGITLHTCSFTRAETEQIKLELEQKWNLKYTIHNKLNRKLNKYYYTIYIGKASYDWLMTQPVIFDTIKAIPFLAHKRRK